MMALLDRLPPRFARLISSLQWRSPFLRKLYVAAAAWYVKRDGVVQNGPAKGLRFNGGGSRTAGFILGTYEPGVQRALTATLQPGMTFYDVGANLGFLSVLAAKLVGPTGRVVSFEPVEANAKRVEYNARLNSFSHVSIYREALGAENKMVSFETSNEAGWGRVSDGTSKPIVGFAGTIDVQMRTLPDAVTLHKLPPPDVIKVDIEGGEVGLLRGAIGFFARSRPVILMELHGTNREVQQSLTEMGYQGFVMGSESAVGAAKWDAFIIACPAERGDLCELARGLAVESTVRR